MSRIFIPQNLINLDPLIITGEIHHHVSRVLKLRRGDIFQAVCGDGFLYAIKINGVNKNNTCGEIVGKEYKDLEPRLQVTLYQGLLKGKKMEEMIPPLVQLGLSGFVPIHTQRCESRPKETFDTKKKRYEKIIQWATALSGRTYLTKIGEILSFKDATIDSQKNNFNIIFWESVEHRPLKEYISEFIEDTSQKTGIASSRNPRNDKNYNSYKRTSVGIFIGPEGGFTEEEMKIAKMSNIIPVSLGKRIIEAVSASVIAMTSLLVISGDI